MSKRYSTRPSDLICVADSYAAYCLDEACMYILCRIEQDGALPAMLEREIYPKNNTDMINGLIKQKGVLHYDYRRNGGGLSDSIGRGF